MSSYAGGYVLPQGASRAQPYEQNIQQSLDKVEELIAFVRDEHFALDTLSFFWRAESRAVLTVQTLGRLLGRPLAEDLHAVRDLVERSLSQNIIDFAEIVAPQLFDLIDAVRPGRFALTDSRAQVEQLHYAVDIRQAVLQHVLTTLNTRYQTPRFRDMGEASRWTAAFGATLQQAERVIQGTRTLLKEEMDATSAYLVQVGRDIEAIEAEAIARFGLIKRLKWAVTLTEAEDRILTVLAERAERIESVAFSGLTDSKSTGSMAAVGRRVPKVALALFGGLATGVAVNQAKDLPLAAASSSLLSALPNALRGSTNPNDTAHLTALSQQTLGTRSARHVREAFSAITEQADAREREAQTIAAAATSRIGTFFSELPAAGQRPLTIESRAELAALLTHLNSVGYNQAEVLRLLGLPSVDAWSQPLTLGVRQGRTQPILFVPQQAEALVTAPRAAVAPAPQTAQLSSATAAMPALNANAAFIVYRVQPDESLADIATRYGTTIQEVAGDNHLMATQVSQGQNLLIRRPLATAPAAPAPAMYSGSKVSASKVDAAARKVARTPAPVGSVVDVQGTDVVSRYGEQLFPSLDAMPPDARTYLVGTVQEVSGFFNVRPGDILGILRLEQNGAGWRLQEQRVSTVGATGVAQIVPRTWNGWASPEHEDYVQSLAAIEEHGGLGFDWAQREVWQAWQEGRVDRSALEASHADPDVFENSVAAVARHLVHWGLTNDFAQSDPKGFADKLADSIAVYNSGRTLDVSAEWTQSSTNQKTTADYVYEAMAISEQVSEMLEQPSVAVAAPEALTTYSASFRQAFDQSFALALSDEKLESFVAANPALREQVESGTADPKAGALQLLDQLEKYYMRQGYEAIRDAQPRPWPFVHNPETLYTQKLAANLLGRTLTLPELDDLMNRTRADRDAIQQALMQRGDARLFSQAKHLYDQMLERSTNGKPVLNSEVAAVVQPLLVGVTPTTLDEAALHALQGRVQSAIRELSSFQEIHTSTSQFRASPLSPMPSIFKGFGVAVAYQAGGHHTGIDLANARTSNGSEPFIYAVDDATVAYVGPLYCNLPDACRGGKAIILDHGNQLYSIYSHNSDASVTAGQRVAAGQPIGRQGNEGYSYGSHLHFEVHTGSPFSGNWQIPFDGGQFVDPAPYLP